MRFEVVPMREADLAEVVAIEEVTGLNRWGYDAYRRELSSNPNAIMLVAQPADGGTWCAGETGGIESGHGTGLHVLGFVASAMMFDELHINNVATHPGTRRMGIGRELLVKAIDEARLRGASFSVLEVRASNVTAQAMYIAMGFRTSRRRKDYYRAPTEDALEMIRDL
ncbi:MAG: ribosomal protein S18-alanine N-acetyltransferase [Blastocatellia bacterium]|jgi:ribosomal-protein-alanine N-acetyltransferase|nr:ribosomal protein S18-alanine N-acetyltransferase [Blastocatellia bacterium]